jgi:hypothetical protein
LARELGPFPRRDRGELLRIEAEPDVVDHVKPGRLQIVDDRPVALVRAEQDEPPQA